MCFVLIIERRRAGLLTKDMAFGLPYLGGRFTNWLLTIRAQSRSSLFLIAIAAGARAKEVPAVLEGLVIPRDGFQRLLAAVFALD